MQSTVYGPLCVTLWKIGLGIGVKIADTLLKKKKKAKTLAAVIVVRNKVLHPCLRSPVSSSNIHEIVTGQVVSLPVSRVDS